MHQFFIFYNVIRLTILKDGSCLFCASLLSHANPEDQNVDDISLFKELFSIAGYSLLLT